MTTYISLGRHCDTTFQIRKHITGETQTNFFDWVRVDFECVLDILNIRNIENMIYKENIRIDKYAYAHEGEMLIIFKNFESKKLNLLFHHDIKHRDYSDEELDEKLTEFMNKYKRRLIFI